MGYWMYDAQRKSEYVEKKKTLSIDLPESGFISSIAIVFKAKNGATSNVDNHIHDCLKKIEIVAAGGRTLKSISGVQAQALNAFDQDHKDFDYLSEIGGEVQIESFNVNFGRYFMDTAYMLDCSKFLDAKLRLTWDLETVRAVGATGFTGDDQTLDVVFVIPHDYKGPAPGSFIKSTETEAWTSLASGTNYTKIPRDYVIRRIMLRAWEPGISPAATLTNVKLNGDNGKIVPFDNTFEKLKDLNAITYPYGYNFLAKVFAKNADVKESHVAYSDDAFFRSVIAKRIAAVTSNDYGELTLSLTDDAGAAIVAEEALNVGAKGHGYHNCFMLPFDKPTWQPELFLQANAFGKLDLELIQGNAGAEVSVVTEEIVPNA